MLPSASTMKKEKVQHWYDNIEHVLCLTCIPSSHNMMQTNQVSRFSLFAFYSPSHWIANLLSLDHAPFSLCLCRPVSHSISLSLLLSPHPRSCLSHSIFPWLCSMAGLCFGSECALHEIVRKWLAADGGASGLWFRNKRLIESIASRWRRGRAEKEREKAWVAKRNLCSQHLCGGVFFSIKARRKLCPEWSVFPPCFRFMSLIPCPQSF